jgi:hypothetical protein
VFLNNLREKAENPKNFYTKISSLGDSVISGKFLADVKVRMQKKFSGKGDLIDIKFDAKNDIKITGFRFVEAKMEVSNLIFKVKAYNFPDYWEDIVELLTSDDQVMVKNIHNGMNEWKRLEANFKLTMPQS